MKYRIFISSVQSEFAKERKALAKYIREDALLGDFFEIFLFEEAPARNKSAQAVYLDEVEKCDVYLGLFGAKYGSRDAQGISVEDLYRTHDSVPRNSLIARAMSWTSYVEKSGSGTGVIIDKCTEHGLARPEFDPTSGFFKTIIWRTGRGVAKGLVAGASRGLVKGPSQGVQSRGPVGGPSQRGRVGTQSRGPVVAQSSGPVVAQSWPSRVLSLFDADSSLSTSEIARACGMVRASGSVKRALVILLDDKLIVNEVAKKTSRLQKYHLTAKGVRLVASFKKKGGRK